MPTGTAILLLALSVAAPPEQIDPPLPAGAIGRLGSPRWRDVADVWSKFGFTPDGKTVIVQSSQLIRAIEFDSGREVWRATTLRSNAGIAFLSEGRLLVGDYDSLRILDQATGQEKSRVASPMASQGLVSDGRHVAVREILGTHGIVVLDLETGQMVCRFGGWRTPFGECHPAGFVTGKSELILRSFGNQGPRVVVLDVKTQKIVHEWKPKRLAGAPFLSDGKLLWVSAEKNLRLLDAITGDERSSWFGHTDAIVQTVAYADGKRLLTASMDRTLRWWDLTAGKELGKIAIAKPAWIAAVSPDGRRAAAVCLGENTLRRFDLEAGRELTLPDGHTNRIEQLAFLPDGSALITASLDGTVRVWDLPARREVRRWAPEHPSLNWLSVSADGKLAATAGYNGPKVRVWETATAKELRSFTVPGLGVAGVAFAPKGATLAASASQHGANTVYLWNAATGPELQQLAGHAGGTGPLAFTPDGKRLVTCMSSNGIGINPDRQARICDLSTSRSRLLDDCQNDAAVVSPDGLSVAAIRQNRVTELVIIELASGQQRLRIDHHSNISSAIGFSPDSRLLAKNDAFPVGTREEVGATLWDADAGKKLGQFQAGFIWALAFAPDGKTLATAGDDSTVLLWDISKFRPVPGTVPSDPGQVWADLAADPARAHAAFRAVVALGDRGVALLREHLKPAAPLDAKQLARLLDDLEDPRFPIRQKAAADLATLHDRIADALWERLMTTNSAEARRAINVLLKKLDGWVAHPDRLREVRAVGILERIATPVARKLLEEWSAGDPTALLTREARTALEHVSR